MEVLVTTGAIRRAKLQLNRHQQQTNTQVFYSTTNSTECKVKYKTYTKNTKCATFYISQKPQFRWFQVWFWWMPWIFWDNSIFVELAYFFQRSFQVRLGHLNTPKKTSGDCQCTFWRPDAFLATKLTVLPKVLKKTRYYKIIYTLGLFVLIPFGLFFNWWRRINVKKQKSTGSTYKQ